MSRTSGWLSICVCVRVRESKGGERFQSKAATTIGMPRQWLFNALHHLLFNAPHHLLFNALHHLHIIRKQVRWQWRCRGAQQSVVTAKASRCRDHIITATPHSKARGRVGARRHSRTSCGLEQVARPHAKQQVARRHAKRVATAKAHVKRDQPKKP